MPAAVTATGSALEMVSCREYDILGLVEIEVFHHGGSITRIAGNLRKRLKTRPAQASRLQTISNNSVKDSTRHPALVVATTHRTLFGSAQALKMWWRFQINPPFPYVTSLLSFSALIPGREHHPKSRFATLHALISFRRPLERIDFIHRPHSGKDTEGERILRVDRHS